MLADRKGTQNSRELLAAAGLRVIRDEPHDDAIAQMISQIDARLRLLRMTAPGRLDSAGMDTSVVLRYTGLARQAVTDGLIGYRLLIAEKPAGGRPHLPRRRGCRPE